MSETISELDIIDIFSDNLRDLMIEVGITQSELIEESGISKGTISKYLNKKCLPTVKNLLNLCYVLNCDVDDLIPILGIIY